MLINAQQYLLNAIPASARILIAGGGTGWILEELTKIHPSGLTIDYIDASQKMISLAKKRNAGNNQVTFITAPVQDISYGPKGYDVVLTPFLFDNFTDSTLQKIFPIIDQRLSREGIWLYCDFEDTGIFQQKVLLKIMYIFFRLCCGIEASQLPDIASCFSKYQYKITGQKTYRKGFVVATIYNRV